MYKDKPFFKARIKSGFLRFCFKAKILQNILNDLPNGPRTNRGKIGFFKVEIHNFF